MADDNKDETKVVDPAATAADTADAAKPGDDDLEKLKRHNKALLSELNGKKAELKDKDEKLTVFERAQADKELAEAKKNGDLEKLLNKTTQESEQKVTAMQSRLIQSELKAAAASAGIIDPDLISMIDLAKIKVDANYEIEGVAEAMAEFKKAKPHLFKNAEADAAAASIAAAAAKKVTKVTGAAVTEPGKEGSGKLADGVKPGTKEADEVVSAFLQSVRK